MEDKKYPSNVDKSKRRPPTPPKSEGTRTREAMERIQDTIIKRHKGKKHENRRDSKS